MSDYPDRIKFDNMFTSEDIDLDTFDFPKLRVRTWSSLFGSGGSYAAEPVVGSTFTRPVMSVKVERDDQYIREHLEGLVKKWNKNPRENWLRILREDGEKQAAYYAGKVASIDDVIEDARVSAERVEKLTAMADNS